MLFRAGCGCSNAKVSCAGVGEGGFRREGTAGVELHAAIRGGGGAASGDDVGPDSGLVSFEFTGLGIIAQHTVDGGAGALGRIPARNGQCASAVEDVLGHGRVTKAHHVVIGNLCLITQGGGVLVAGASCSGVGADKGVVGARGVCRSHGAGLRADGDVAAAGG